MGEACVTSGTSDGVWHDALWAYEAAAAPFWSTPRLLSFRARELKDFRIDGMASVAEKGSNTTR